MADHVHGQGIQRPCSIRSVASNSSIASGVSLTRRARTRARSKTLTNTSSPRLPDSLPKSPASELPYLGVNSAQEPVPNLPNSPNEALAAPPRPPRSPRRSTHEVVQGQLGDGLPSMQESDPSSTSRATEESQMHQRPVKLSSQTSGMQILPTAAQPEPPLSAFSRDPELTGVDSSAVNVRDSISTQLSGLSSSVYPPSTSTASGPDSPPSPRSMVEQQDNYDVSSYDPEVGEAQEYDGDDVSYRLRLLVNNSYFLPPAHSKPSPEDFAVLGSSSQKKPAKPSTPTFFDLFRGKAKSKPSTPTGPSPGFDPAGPALRTAADSITTAHVLRPQPRSSSQIPRKPTPGTRTGRVVVVREKMQDLAVAAKQAEQDMKARAVRRDQDSQTGQTTSNNVIDPTDAVDLPPPSSNYPFAVQASALHGLGVQDSVGAALLADRLPPPQSPGKSSSFDPEDHWRKALLHQAVHHSLDSTSPDTSFSMMLATSTPLASPRVGQSQGPSHGPSPAARMLLEQRIISNPRFSDTSPPAISRKKSSQSVASASSMSKGPAGRKPPSLDTSGPSHVTPLRSDTPSGPLTPLTPAPRKHVINPLYSMSQTDFSRFEPRGRADGPSRTSVRRTKSTPMLSDAYESDARSMVMTPPPLPTPSTSFSDLQRNRSLTTSHSYYSDQETIDDEELPRGSLALSAVEGRPSLSEYSQPSPTMSAFHDAPTELREEFPNHPRWRPSVDNEAPSTRESPIPRYSAMSPPPRISSSLAHIALSPPPRSSSFHYQALQARANPSPPILEADDLPYPSTPLTDDTTLIINAPEPTTPPFPICQRRGISTGRRLSLDIPPTNIPVAIHSAPGPVSPTSFFDSIQAQPNAMDDLESSSDESEDEDDTRLNPPSTGSSDPRSRSMSITPSSPRPSFMRLGNHSTPYVSQSSESRRSPLAFKDKPPVGNVPIRAPFFTERSGKSDQGHGPPVSSFDFYKYAQQSLQGSAAEPSNSTSKRRSTVGPAAAWRSNPKAQESLRKLDGMLIQHMEAEKDTIKRIATTARSNIPVEDVVVVVERNYLLVGVEGQAAIVKGRLYSNVSTATSVWQLEPRKSRISGRERTTSSVSTSSTQSSYAFVSDPEISSSFAASLESGQVSDADDISPSPALSSPSMSSDERVLPPFPHRKAHSNAAASRSASPGHALRSMTSSYSSLESLQSPNSGKLLTLHLEKEQSIIWPSLIVGPAPDYLSPPVTDSVLFDASLELENQYNMDPTSLVLIGLELFDIRKDKEEAFECFIRAWHQAHVPTAAMRLASHYLPITTYNLDVMEDPAPRGTTAYYLQCIGGRRGLAQLYLDAGLLHLEGAATTLLSASYSSLSSIRVPLHAQVGEGGTAAWMRDREAAAEFFERARLLEPSLEIPSLPLTDPRHVSDELEMQMPSIDTGTGTSEPGSRSEASHSQYADAETSMLRRRRKKDEMTLFDSRAAEDDVDNTWYLYIPGLVGAGTALLVVGIVGALSLSTWSRRNQGS
ncbi:hypothetical protein D9615_009561 [Tricholomella constricta]|uniref:Uncharacterized protein n=1 Tax=Tricholomella constricta TaxID=117010 RepID=A0A8H5LW85_9AGAR|nr:hypothetical protein D9615_009561 [Tricholomella constricta]